jgi:hypothetical protein
MIFIEADTNIEGNPEIVFAVHSDFRQRPLWHDHVLSSDLLTSEPIGLGSRFRTVNKTGGLTVTTNEQITVFDPPHYYCYELDNGPFHFKCCQRFEPIPTGTHYQIRIEMTASNRLGRIFLPLIARQQRAHFFTAVQELKHYIESQNDRI